MADKVKVWFDPEGDFLEVQFSDAPGFASHGLRGRDGACGRTGTRVGIQCPRRQPFQKRPPS